MNEQEREALHQRLLTYPGATPESVEQQLYAYEQRESVKQTVMQDRGMSNALAEAYLDRTGYPRPPGWHSVFFYTGSNRPRNGYVLVFVVLLAAVAVFF